MTAEILIIDDEEAIRSAVTDILSDEGYETREACNSQTAFEAIEAKKPDLVILDIWLEDSELDGIEILKKIKATYKNLPVIMISGHGNIETAVSAIQFGAYDFIEKPFNSDKLMVLAKRALETVSLQQENQELKQKVTHSVGSDLDGDSLYVLQLRQTIERVAPTNSRVLILGDAGTGKEVVANMIHRLSPQSERAYIVLNCASLSPERLEEELFGIENGKKGVLEQADGGILLLDEVADMPLETQGKIVRVLQDQRFVRIGGNREVEVDVRILASTSHDLETKISDGDFRQDLYFRLNVVPIQLKPLKERREDISSLAEKILQQLSTNDMALTNLEFSEDAMAILQSYDWPGNVRQLRNVIEWVLIMHQGGNSEASENIITAELLPPELKQQATPAMLQSDQNVELMTKPLREAREIFEREYLLSQVSRFGGNISKTASFVGMERSALHRKLKSLGVNEVKERAEA